LAKLVDVREQEGKPIFKSIKCDFIEILENDVLDFYCFPSCWYRELCKASVVHPEKGLEVVSEKSLLYLLSVLVHWFSNEVEIARDFLVVSAVLD
jgi:hypothetical protein